MRILPILFNGEMVRAILDGRKTCTRRVVKPQWNGCDNCMCIHDEFLYDSKSNVVYCARCGEPLSPARKPPYQPGDILYVRETVWRETGYYVDINGEIIITWHNKFRYVASDKKPEPWGTCSWIKCPSIHMPKEAARIWLRVTDVRLERLQAITEDGAKAEGMPDSLDYPVDKAYCPLCKGEGIIGTVDVHSLGHMDVDCPYCDSHRKRFENLWDSINQKYLDCYGWAANPWVWVIEFERCEKPEE